MPSAELGSGNAAREFITLLGAQLPGLPQRTRNSPIRDGGSAYGCLLLKPIRKHTPNSQLSERNSSAHRVGSRDWKERVSASGLLS
jgi:hypothetical protein